MKSLKVRLSLTKNPCKPGNRTLIMKLLITLLLFFSNLLHAEPLFLVTEEIPPYAYKQNGKPAGASVEIIKALFKEAEIPYKISIYPWKRALETAKSKQACIFPIQRSQEREALFNWVSPVLITQTGFYTTPKSKVNIRTLDDVKNYSIGTYRGSAVEDYLTHQGFNVVSTSTDNVNIRKLSSNRIDVWAADTLTASYLADKEKKEIREALVYFTTLRALACNLTVPKDQVKKLQQALQTIYQKGTVDNILRKYKR
jgi:polar amino acid transport system substrate-binding protein